MNVTRQAFPKEEIYKSWNFSVSTYSFTVPNGPRVGEVLKLVELKTKTKRWSEQLGNYYTQSQYITISEDQLLSLLTQAKV